MHLCELLRCAAQERQQCSNNLSSGPCSSVAGKPLHVIVDRPWVNGLMDDLGQLHLLLLLQVSVKAYSLQGTNSLQSQESVW